MSSADPDLPVREHAAASTPGPAVEYGVGELVVYAGHGIGRISAIRPAAGGDALVVLELAGTLIVTLPVARAQEALRGVSDEAALSLVGQALREVSPPEDSWARRIREAKAQVTRGEAVGLAEVVREGIRREQRSAASGRPITSTSERELYVRARQLLAAEISVSRDVDLAVADLWIADQVPAEPLGGAPGPDGPQPVVALPEDGPRERLRS